MNKECNVLIVGASGHLGSKIVENLLNNKNSFKLSLIVPNESKEKCQQFEKRCECVHVVDVLNTTETELCKYLKDIDLVINCMNFIEPHDEYAAEHNLIQACVKAGVERYIPSDFSVDYRNLSDVDLPRVDVRQRIHEELNKTKLKWTSILCGIILEKVFCKSLNMIDREKKTVNYYGEGNEQFNVCSYDDVAKFVSTLIIGRHLNKYDYKFVPIYSDTVSWKTIANNLQDVWGQEMKFNKLGSIQDLDKRIQQVKESDKELFYHLQYCRVMLMKEGQLKELDNEVWPTITKTNIKNFVRQWAQETAL